MIPKHLLDKLEELKAGHRFSVGGEQTYNLGAEHMYALMVKENEAVLMENTSLRIQLAAVKAFEKHRNTFEKLAKLSKDDKELASQMELLKRTETK